ncbi:MAG: hypothetical protein AAFV26_06380, partial [Pseudomonadota bacterium]
ASGQAHALSKAPDGPLSAIESPAVRCSQSALSETSYGFIKASHVAADGEAQNRASCEEEHEAAHRVLAAPARCTKSVAAIRCAQARRAQSAVVIATSQGCQVIGWQATRQRDLVGKRRLSR